MPIKYFPYVVAAVIAGMLLSLYFSWLQIFFFGAEHAQVQGIDYFSAPRSFLNLLEKRSMFDTWEGVPYGPYATWYLAHPAFGVFIASWFSFFSPWTSYWLFVVFSLTVMVYCGYLISRTTDNTFKKQLCVLILACAFPTYWLLYVGNIHALLVLSLTLILLSIYELTYTENRRQARQKLLIGLLLSLLTKPLVLLMLPLLLIIPETRKTAFISVLVYAAVSWVFISLPMLNPQGIGWHKIIQLAFDFDFIKQHMNIYNNQFVLNAYMKDNSMHWFNIIAQGDYRPMHIDVFSLPVFVDTLIGRETSTGFYKLPVYISLILSIAVAFIKDNKIRMESVLLLIMAISLTFFLSYNAVWEYQFTSALPIVALLLSLREKNVFYKKIIPALFIIGLFFCLPSAYFLVRNGDYTSVDSLTLIRLDRIIPALLLYLLMTVQLIAVISRQLLRRAA